MLTPEQEQALLDAAALGIDDRLREAYRKLVALIGEGMPPREAIAAVMRDFRGEYAEILAKGFSAILARSVGAESVYAMQVAGVTLSQRLYRETRETSAVVARLVNDYAKGWQQARELALAIYEGYGFKEAEALNLSPRNHKLPKYLRETLLRDPTLAGELRRHFARMQAASLKTPALKAAYLQYLDGLENGIGQEALNRRIQVAFHERMRYFANRIAQTELHRAYADAQARELMDDPDVEFVQWRMSGTHPKTDICDLFARVDRYGLGPGVYPKALAPKAPAHPFCRCVLSPRLDLTGRKAREKPGAERAWLREQGLQEAAGVMGSKAKAQAVMKGAEPLEVWNAGIDPEYRVRRVGDVAAGRMPAMRQVATLDQIRQFLAGNGESAIVVARVPEDIKRSLGASADEVLLSRYTADKQAKHPEITAASFAWLQDMLDRGERLYDRKRHAAVIHYREQPYIAVLKATVRGNEVYLQSFRRTDRKNIAALKRRAGGGG